VSPPDTAAAAGSELLDPILEAERSLAYSGYKTAVHGEQGAGRRTRMQVSRLEDGRMVLEWEQGGETGRRWVVRARHRWIDDPALLLANYDVEVVPGEADRDVAWRAVQQLELRPRHPGRPSMTLLVDAETRLVLAERLRDHDGVERFAWQFDTIDYEPVPLDGDEAEIVAAPEHDEADPCECDWAVLAPAELPAGFERVGCRKDADGALVEYFSDGLAAFAFRQRPAEDLGGPHDGELERRSCSGRSSVSGVIEGIEVLLLGNLPVDDLEAVAASLRVAP
jgi:negative regulator of sigma E activity